MQTLFPTARIRRGVGVVCTFERAPRDINGITYLAPGGCERTIKEMLDSSYSDAFLVIKGDAILSEQYFNGMDAGSHHLVNSVTKSFVGMLAGIVAARGELDVAQTVAHYLPEFTGCALAGTRVRQLLDMRAEVAYDEDYADPLTDFWHESAVVGWRPALKDEHSATSLSQYARRLSSPTQCRGGKWYYQTVLTNVLGMVLEHATGIDLATLLSTEIWSKLGAEQDASIVVDPSGFPYVGAGMSACARDLARFGAMLIGCGAYNGQTIVPHQWLKDTCRADPDTIDAFRRGDYGQVLPGWHYRNQVWVKDGAHGVMAAIGIHGQTIYMDRDRRLVMVKLSSQPEPLDYNLYLDGYAAMEALACCLE